MTLNGEVFPAWWLDSCFCRLRYVSSLSCFGAGHRCLGKFLTEGLLGLTSPCCFCDLVRVLVSQKPLCLASRGCLQPGPVITGHQGGLPSVSCSDTVAAHGCRRSGRGRARRCGSQHAPFLVISILHLPQMDPSFELLSVVCFKWATT